MSDTKSSLTSDAENRQYKLVTSRLIMARDLNSTNSLFGGLLVQWADETAAIYVMNVLRSHHVVTAKISEVLYNEPTKIGDVLEFFMRVKTVGNTSITVECQVESSAVEFEEIRRLILCCDFVFVKIDKMGKPTPHHYADLIKHN